MAREEPLPEWREDSEFEKFRDARYLWRVWCRADEEAALRMDAAISGILGFSDSTHAEELRARRDVAWRFIAARDFPALFTLTCYQNQLLLRGSLDGSLTFDEERAMAEVYREAELPDEDEDAG